MVINTRPARYEIRVAEQLEGDLLEWFLDGKMAPVEKQTGPGTLLRGNLPDQSALFGLLTRIRDINLTLLEVRRIDETQEFGKTV